MLIRDDRGFGRWGADQIPTLPTKVNNELDMSIYGFDAVLCFCTKCRRSHFVTVDGCPDEATARRETAQAA